MKEIEIIGKLKQFKEKNNYTLHDLAKYLDIQVPTIDRWFRTRRINRIYALYVQEKLKNMSWWIV